MFGMSVEHLMVLTVVVLPFGSKRIPERAPAPFRVFQAAGFFGELRCRRTVFRPSRLAS